MRCRGFRLDEPVVPPREYIDRLDRYPAFFRKPTLVDTIGTSLDKDAGIPVALAHDLVLYIVGVGPDVLVVLARGAQGIRSGPGIRIRFTVQG